MATSSRLARDPNTSNDDVTLLRRIGRNVRSAVDAQGSAVKYAPQNAPNPIPDLGNAIDPLRRDFMSGFEDPPGMATPAAASSRPKTANSSPAVDPLTAEQRTAATNYGTLAGTAAKGYLDERKALAPGVRRWVGGTSESDPAQVYISVDKNGNRVYTDNAKFAAGMSNGRALTRRDLAPGAAEADRTATLTDPEGGYTYAPASKNVVAALSQASDATRGKSPQLERALAEARRSQAIADTASGDRPLDQKRRKQSADLRRNLGLPDASGGLNIRDLIALQANDRAERQFAHTVENDKANNNRNASNDDRAMRAQQTQTVLGIRNAIKDGSIDENTGYAMIGALVNDINTPAGRAAQQEANTRLAAQTAANNRGLGWFKNFGFDSGEAKDVTLDQLHVNPDGSGSVAEPDIGMFDEGDTTGIGPRDLRSALGSDELAQQLLKYTQKQRLARGQ